MPRAPVAAAKAIDSSVMDALFECYLDWKESSQMVRDAYDRWREAVSGGRGTAFAAYMAALEDEADASSEYAALIGSVRLARDCAPSNRRCRSSMRLRG
jgi:hypothetical protein